MIPTAFARLPSAEVGFRASGARSRSLTRVAAHPRFARERLAAGGDELLHGRRRLDAHPVVGLGRAGDARDVSANELPERSVRRRLATVEADERVAAVGPARVELEPALLG